MRNLTALLLLLGLPAVAMAAEEDFIGNWLLQVQEGRAQLHGLLSIQQTEMGLAGFVENSPIELQIEGDRIRMVVDDWGRAGGRIERHYRGFLENGAIVGEFGPDFELDEGDAYICKVSAANCPYPEGNWSASRYQEPEGIEFNTGNLLGNWRSSSEGLRRWTKDVTPQGSQWLAEFDVRTELPRQRCVHYSVWGHMMYWGSMEVLSSGDPNVMTWIVGDAVRRVYFDDRAPDEDADHKPMGFSKGSWDGNTLVIRTTHLLGSVLGFNGNPMSENSVIEERITALDEDTLQVTMTLYDPAHYKQPPVFRRTLSRSEPSQRVSMWASCDPDSFYREMWLDGRMESYWERSDRRF